MLEDTYAPSRQQLQAAIAAVHAERAGPPGGLFAALGRIVRGLIAGHG